MKYIIDKNKGYTGNILSTIDDDKDSIVHYTKLTLSEYEKERGIKALVLSWEELLHFIREFESSTYTSKDPKIIDAETYEEALNCLPPLNYKQGIFAISEMLTGELTAWYAERNGKYATCTDYSYSNFEHMVKRFSAVL